MQAEVIYGGRVKVTPEFEGEEFDAHKLIEDCFDGVMRELVKLKLADPMVDGSIATGHVEVSAVVEADSIPAAVAQVDAAFHAAFHAAGVGTKGWEDGETHRVTVEWETQRLEKSPALVDV